MTVCGVEFINCSNCGCGCPLYSYVKKGEKEEKVQHCETDFCPTCGMPMTEWALEIFRKRSRVSEPDFKYIKVGDTIYTQDDDKQGWTGKEVE